MKKIYLSAMLMFITLASALCQVTVSFTLSGATSLSVPPAGLSNVNFSVNLSKPAGDVTEGKVFIYAKGGSANANKLNYEGSVSSVSWSGSGATRWVSLSGSFSISQSQLSGVSGVLFAQYESNLGVNVKSDDIVATIPISNNTITPPSVTSFNGSGNPSVIFGSMPAGGTNSYTYQWQSSTVSSTTGFTNISSATNTNYDPPTISQTTYYRRVVTSGSLTSTSNVITITISAFPPISNNSISNSGGSLFYGSSDPSVLNGSLPTGGDNFFTYQWQSSTTSAGGGFNNVAAAINQNYDPPTISQTTYYRRVVTSGGITNTSNVITITIRPLGSTFDSPINLGNLDICAQTGDNRSPIGYGNEYGNSFEDIYYKFNLIRSAKISLYNCKQDGAPSLFYLLGANGSAIQGTEIESCDVGVQRDYDLQAGTYYIVTEVQDSYTVTANFDLYVFPIVSISGNTTIAQGSSTTLTASGADSYTWEPATGLSSTTGSSVIATPSVTTTYLVRANPNTCVVYKYITVTVTGTVGSTITNPIVANIGGCGYNSPSLYINGYGNEYGGSQNDIFFRFELSSVSEVSFSGYSPNGFNLTLLNSAGAFVAAKQYGWVWVDPGGDESGYSVIGELDGIPFRPMLQPGVYFLVAEAPANNVIYVSIDTPSGYSCRKETNQFPVKRKADAESNDNLAGTISYPNPASQYLSFKLDQDAKATVYFINSYGVVLKSTSIFRNAERSDISDLPNGLYLVKIVQGDTIKYEKIVVER